VEVLGVKKRLNLFGVTGGGLFGFLLLEMFSTSSEYICCWASTMVLFYGSGRMTSYCCHRIARNRLELRLSLEDGEESAKIWDDVLDLNQSLY
jgi:hypothetical protein